MSVKGKVKEATGFIKEEMNEHGKYANFSYQAQSWKTPRRVVAKVEWHPGELYPRVGFIVTNMTRPAARVVAFYNKRGTCEQWIKEGKGAIKWTRLSCCSFAANAVRLQLHALAYNLANFMRTLALPEAIEQWSPTSLREKLVKIGAKVVRHGRYVVFQMAEVAVSMELFQKILRLIAELRPQPPPAPFASPQRRPLLHASLIRLLPFRTTSRSPILNGGPTANLSTLPTVSWQ